MSGRILTPVFFTYKWYSLPYFPYPRTSTLQAW